MSIVKMSSNTEIRQKGECAAARAVGHGLSSSSVICHKRTITRGRLASRPKSLEHFHCITLLNSTL
jgi:hypothetical protein